MFPRIPAPRHPRLQAPRPALLPRYVVAWYGLATAAVGACARPGPPGIRPVTAEPRAAHDAPRVSTGSRTAGAATPDAGVVVLDLTPKFLAFYDSATARPLDPDARWALWKHLDGFAAVPPTPFGVDTLARRLLDAAWPRYPAALPRIRQGVAAYGVVPDSVLGRVAAVLGCGAPPRVRLVAFVGGFEANAFAYGSSDGLPTVAVPIEAGDAARAMAHEFAHIIHRGRCTTFTSGYAQGLAELVVTEGVAMQVVAQLFPGDSAASYVQAPGAPGWFAAASARRTAILQGVRAHATERGVAAVQRFTFGGGTTGLPREAYYAGWEITEALLRGGMSLHDIASTPPERLPALIASVVDRLPATGTPSGDHAGTARGATGSRDGDPVR